jgi:hypothetical protein
MLTVVVACGSDKNALDCWALVAHACNPSYSGGRDQGDRDSKPAWGNSTRDPVLKIPTHKGLGKWLKV